MADQRVSQIILMLLVKAEYSRPRIDVSSVCTMVSLSSTRSKHASPLTLAMNFEATGSPTSIFAAVARGASVIKRSPLVRFGYLNL